MEQTATSDKERVTKEQLQELVNQVKQKVTEELSLEKTLPEGTIPLLFIAGLGATLAAGTYLALRRPRSTDGKPLVGQQAATLASLGAGVAGAAASAAVAYKLTSAPRRIDR